MKRQKHDQESTSFKMCNSTEKETQVPSTESEDDTDQDSTDTKQDPDYAAPNETARSNTLTLTVPRNITGRAVAATLDRCNISSEAASHVLASVVKEGGGDLDEVSISASTIRRRRSANRKVLSDQMKLRFSPSSHTVVHWNGKLLDEHGEGKSERLTVMVSENNSVTVLQSSVFKESFCRQER